jgi:hypothetical protein
MKILYREKGKREAIRPPTFPDSVRLLDCKNPGCYNGVPERGFGISRKKRRIIVRRKAQ